MEVARQRHEAPEQVSAELGDDPLPHHAEEVRLEEAADRLDDEQPEEDQDEAVEPCGIATGDDLGRDARDDQREQQPQQRRQDQPDHRDGESPGVRPQVAEQARPRHAAEAAHLADDSARIGRDARELLGHVPMMSPGRCVRGGDIVEMSCAGSRRLESAILRS